MTRLMRHVIKKWLLYVTLLLISGALIFYTRDLIRLFGSAEAIERTVASWGAMAPIAFFLMNVAQVILAPIPGTAIGVVGGYLFGLWIGFFLNLVGIVVGSLIAFWLAKRFGKPFVDRFVGPRTAHFLERVAERNGIRGLTLIFLLPFLPDDALCFMAGLTSLRTRTFLLILLIGRTPGALVASLTGAGLVDLPLWAWIVIGLAGMTLLLLWWFKGAKIEERVRNFFSPVQTGELEDEQ